MPKGKWLNLHAIWIGQDDVEGWFLQAQCSNCLKWAHKMNPYTHEFEYNFCPSCGSEMLTDTDAGEIANLLEFRKRMKR